ncbi:MAG: hypothetical protein ABIK92_10335 [Pseudomonadota bacterium]
MGRFETGSSDHDNIGTINFYKIQPHMSSILCTIILCTNIHDNPMPTWPSIKDTKKVYYLINL